MNEKRTYTLWITLAILLTSLNDLVKAENKRIEVDSKQLEYQRIDKHWNEMNRLMKESAE